MSTWHVLQGCRNDDACQQAYRTVRGPISPGLPCMVNTEYVEVFAAKPNDSGRWGESRVALTLAEV